MPVPNDARLLARALQSGMITEEQFSTILHQLLRDPSTSLSDLLFSAAGLSRHQLEALGKPEEVSPSTAAASPADVAGWLGLGGAPSIKSLVAAKAETSRSDDQRGYPGPTASAPGRPGEHHLGAPPITVLEPIVVAPHKAAPAALDNEDAPTVPAPVSTLSSTPQIEGQDRYRLDREVGHGGLGRVWLAHDQHLACPVALKEMLPGRDTNAQAVARFIREARITGRLTHPGIVPVHELGRRPEGNYFYTMKFLEGRTFRDAIRAFHKLPPSAPERSVRQHELLRLFQGVCHALAFAHSRNVIHRDLKPANIMLGDFGEAIVVDWGLAKVLDAQEQTAAESESPTDPLLDDLTRAGAIMGTPAYMSPEQALGQVSRLDARSDVFSLGVILYELLVGTGPFPGKTAREIVANVRLGIFTPPRTKNRNVSPALAAVCLQAMALAPADRYPSASALAADIGCWLAGEPVSVYREPWPTRARRWARRHRTLSLLGTTVVLMLGLSVGLWLGYQSQRLGQVRSAAVELVREGRSALLTRKYEDARLHLTGALVLVQPEAGLTDIETDVRALLSEAEHALQRQQLAEATRRSCDQFLQLRDAALSHGTGFTGLDVRKELEAAQASAEQALRLFHTGSKPGEIAPEHRSHLTAPQQEELALGRLELLLVLADVALAREEAGPEALHYLDQAAAGPHPLKAVALRRSLHLQRSGQIDAAAREQQRAEALQPREAVDFFFLGKDLYDRERYSEAAEHFERALQRDPGHFWAQYFLALTHLRREQPAQAVAHLTASLSRRPRLHWIYLVRGYAYGLLGEFRQAREDFQQAEGLCAGPDYGLLVNRGNVSLLQALQKPGKPDAARLQEAVTDFQRAIALKPDQYQAHVNLARAHQELKQLDQALEAIETAIDKAPELPLPYTVRARIHLSREELPAALANLQKALERTKTQGRAEALLHCERWRILYRQEQHQEALAACQAALKVQPEYADAHRFRGESLLALKQPADAASAFDDYFRHQGKQVSDVYQARGLAHALANNYAAAIADYTRALELDGRAHQMRVRRGWAYVMQAPRLAEADFDAALRQVKQDGDAWTGRGYARVQQGAYRTAVRDAEEALKYGSKTAGIVYNAACIYAQAIVPAEKDKANPKGAELAESYRARAVELIRQALQTMPADERADFIRQVIRVDSALDPLRPYPPFQKLLTAQDG